MDKGEQTWQPKHKLHEPLPVPWSSPPPGSPSVSRSSGASRRRLRKRSPSSGDPGWWARALRALAAGLVRIWKRMVLLAPFGVFVDTKPRHYREMLQVLWENRGRWLYALRILKHGVCDGCSLGPRGLRDDVIDGVHLCLTRLKLLRLNTMGPIRASMLTDVDA